MVDLSALDKVELRREFLDCRWRLSIEEHGKRSQIIQRRLMALEAFKSARSLAIYSSFKGEVETGLILQEGLRMGKEMLLPLVKEEERLLTFVAVRGKEELVGGRYGILVPPWEPDRIKPLKEIELMLVPGLAFDLCGRRLGYGGGYYDRTLCGLGHGPVRVGVAFDFQVVEELPGTEAEVKVAWIVTEERVVEIKPGH